MTPYKIKFTPQQLSFVKINYPDFGPNFCAEQLGMSVNQVKRIAGKVKVKCKPETRSKLLEKPENELRISIDKFRNITTPEAAYILGILWADGHISKVNINIEIIESDARELIDIFKTTGDWIYRTRTRKADIKRNNKPLGSFSLCCIQFFNFLKKFDYHIKSGTSAKKILKHIPEHLRHYWWRGYFDGDGCLTGGNTTSKGYHFLFASTYEQNWDFCEKLFRNLKVKYKIYKKINFSKTFNRFIKSSYIRVINKRNICVIMNFIFSGKLLGFSRKRNKWVAVQNRILSSKKRPSIDILFLLEPQVIQTFNLRNNEIQI